MTPGCAVNVPSLVNASTTPVGKPTWSVTAAPSPVASGLRRNPGTANFAESRGHLPRALQSGPRLCDQNDRVIGLNADQGTVQHPLQVMPLGNDPMRSFANL